MQIARVVPRAVWMLALACASCATQPAAPALPDAVPQRIVSIVPSATEMLFAMGLQDRVVAVSDYDRLEPEAGDIPRVGALLNPNIEKIIELRPDLVISYGTQDVLRDRLHAIGIRLHPFTHGNIEETLQYMQELGRLAGTESEAQRIIGRIRNAFEEIRGRAAPARPKVLLIHSRAPGVLGSFYSIGSAAFQSELIGIAGGVNLFEDIATEVVQPTLEEILARAPEIIVETLPEPPAEAEIAQRKADWQRLGNIPAVARGRIYIVGADFMLTPGPRLDQAAQLLQQIISAP